MTPTTDLPGFFSITGLYVLHRMDCYVQENADLTINLAMLQAVTQYREVVVKSPCRDPEFLCLNTTMQCSNFGVCIPQAKAAVVVTAAAVSSDAVAVANAVAEVTSTVNA